MATNGCEIVWDLGFASRISSSYAFHIEGFLNITQIGFNSETCVKCTHELVESVRSSRSSKQGPFSLTLIV
jgi:hypothetical protein